MKIQFKVMESLPPFYIGQRVVCIDDKQVVRGETRLKEGSEYTIKGIDSCCNVWYVDVGICNELGYQVCFHCRKIIMNDMWYVGARRFAPIQENFQSISLTKVLEQETKLIGVN